MKWLRTSVLRIHCTQHHRVEGTYLFKSICSIFLLLQKCSLHCTHNKWWLLLLLLMAPTTLYSIMAPVIILKSLIEIIFLRSSWNFFFLNIILLFLFMSPLKYSIHYFSCNYKLTGVMLFHFGFLFIAWSIVSIQLMFYFWCWHLQMETGGFTS